MAQISLLLIIRGFGACLSFHVSEGKHRTLRGIDVSSADVIQALGPTSKYMLTARKILEFELNQERILLETVSVGISVFWVPFEGVLFSMLIDSGFELAF